MANDGEPYRKGTERYPGTSRRTSQVLRGNTMKRTMKTYLVAIRVTSGYGIETISGKLPGYSAKDVCRKVSDNARAAGYQVLDVAAHLETNNRARNARIENA